MHCGLYVEQEAVGRETYGGCAFLKAVNLVITADYRGGRRELAESRFVKGRSVKKRLTDGKRVGTGCAT